MLVILLATIIYAPAYSLDDDNPIIIDDVIDTKELCDLNNGTLTIVINTAYTGLEYSIDGGLTYQSEPYFDQLSSGDYLVVVRDDTGCSQNITIQIVNAPLPIISVDQECVDNLNKADVDLMPFSEGIFPFSYNWVGPNNQTFDTQNLRQVDPGMYSVTVTDRIGCQIDTSFLIEQCCELSILCNNTDTTYFPCLKDVTDINSEFLDNESADDTRIARGLGIMIDKSCADVVISAADTYNQNQDCDDGPLEITRIYNVDDGVNVSSCSSVIIVDHFTEPQVLQDANDLLISCEEDVEQSLSQWVEDLAGAEIVACGEFSVTTIPDVYTLDYSCIGTGDIDVEFVILDECDNTLSFSSTFYVSDNVSPIIYCPVPTSLLVDDSDFDQLLDEWLEGYTSSDNCSISIVETDLNLGNITYNCDYEELEVTFIASDDCGNQSSCLSTVTIGNLYTPTITCPENIIVQCEDNIESILSTWETSAFALGYNNTALAVISDLDLSTYIGRNCVGPQEIQFSIDVTCFQDRTCSSSISIEDNVSPVIFCPKEIVIDQASNDYLAQIESWLESCTASDNCSLPTLENDFDIADLALCNSGDIDIQFVATDLCDNVSACNSFIRLSEYSTSIQCPEPISITCDSGDKLEFIESWSSSSYGLQYGMDSLSATMDVELSTIDLSCGSIEVIFSITDDCGETLSCTSSIEITDTVQPLISCPEAINIDVSDINVDQLISDWVMSAAAEDNCSEVSISHDWNGEYQNIQCTEEVVLLFVATDECDNQSDCTATLSLESPSTSEVICPDIFTAYCDDEFLDEKIREHLTTTEAIASHSYALSHNIDFEAIDRDCESDYYIDYDIILTDACDNSSDCSSTLHILPPPRIYIPNIFMPGLQKNNIFTVYSNDSVLEVTSMIIYDRWGSLIYEENNFPSNDEDYGWDGQFNQTLEKSNVMTYQIIVQGVLGELIDFTGSVQVMK